MIAALVVVRKDVLPYTLAGGEPVKHYRLNTIGLRRRGVTGERYAALEAAFRALRDGHADSGDAGDRRDRTAARLARGALEARPARLPPIVQTISAISIAVASARRPSLPETAGGRPWRIDSTNASISTRSASLRRPRSPRRRPRASARPSPARARGRP